MRHGLNKTAGLRGLIGIGLIGIGLMGLSGAAAAAPDLDAHNATTLGADWIAVSPSHLDDMRGGFDLDPGLKVSFGIERAIYVNGSLMTSTSIHVPNAAGITGDQAAALHGALDNTVKLIQNGPGNTFQSTLSAASAPATIVQNTLNDQHIQSLTIINTSVNSLALLKSLNLQSVLNDALANAIGVR